MAQYKTLADVRPQAGDIYRVRLNQRVSGDHEQEVEVEEVVASEQQLHAVCRSGATGERVSLGQGTTVLENLW